MVNLDELKARGLRAYEAGRVRTAARIALFLIPAAAICLLEVKARETCACISVLLLGLCVWLRWRDRRGMKDVTTGLLAGSIPLVAGLAAGRIDAFCVLVGGPVACEAFSAVAGVLAGLLIAVRETRQHARLWSWFTTGTIAILTASLGCARLGFTGIASAAIGIALGAAATAVIARRAA